MKTTGGQDLTAEQERELDDEYLASNPSGYFMSRITSLIVAAEAPLLDLTQALAADFRMAIGQPNDDAVLTHSGADRELQVALDSFGLRHSAAEALVRLYLAVIDQRAQGGCLWLRVSSGPPQHKELVEQVLAHLHDDEGRSTMWEVFLPPETTAADPADLAKINQALNVAVAWLKRACDLLVDEEMNLNIANNKIKHGVAVRARDDILSTFTLAGPDVAGYIPLSALTGPEALPIINSVSVDILAQLPKQHPAKPGWELTSLGLKPAPLLAESWLFASTHSAIFHLAARRHFGTTHETAGPFPALVTGPTPADLLGRDAVGIRWPLTAGRGGGPPRLPVVGFGDRLLPFEPEGRAGVVVDG